MFQTSALRLLLLPFWGIRKEPLQEFQLVLRGVTRTVLAPVTRPVLQLDFRMAKGPEFPLELQRAIRLGLLPDFQLESLPEFPLVLGARFR